MLNTILLSSAADSYMSKFDVVDKKTAIETTIISINESIVELENLKEILKSIDDKLSVANILSMCLTISSQTKEISELNGHLNLDRHL